MPVPATIATGILFVIENDSQLDAGLRQRFLMKRGIGVARGSIALGIIPIQAHRAAAMQNVFELIEVDAHALRGLFGR
jgi:hypothetical protein